MGLKAIVAKLEDVAEGFRSLYRTVDGKFVLDVDEVDGFALENITGLRTALSKEREDRRTAQESLTKATDSLKAFEGLDPKTTREKLTKAEELLKIDPQKEADRLTSERVKGWTDTEGARFKGELEARDKKLASLTTALAREMIESKAVLAITAAKGKVKPLLPHVLAKCRVREVDGAYVAEVLDVNGNPRLDSEGKPVKVDQLVTEFKADPDFAGNFEGTGRSGSGSGPGAGPGAGGGGGTPPTKSVDRIKAGLEELRAGGH